MILLPVAILLISPAVAVRTSWRIAFASEVFSFSARMKALPWVGSRSPDAASDVVMVALASASRRVIGESSLVQDARERVGVGGLLDVAVLL